MCRRATWPDSTQGYELDLVGRTVLQGVERVLIIEDETYTGSSVRDLAALCISDLGARLKRLLVFVVVDSMRRTERRALATFLSQAMAQGRQRKRSRPAARTLG